MKYVTFKLIVLLLCNTVFSQEKQLDSIITTTNSITDSLNIDLATDLIYELSKQEKYDLGLKYCDTLIETSMSINYTKGTGKLYIEKANIFNITDKSKKALQSYDLAENYFKSSNYNKGIAVVNNNKAIIEHRLGNLEESLALLLNSSFYYKKLNDSISMADTYNNIGNVHKTLKRPLQAKEHYKKSIEIKRKNKLKNLASTLNNLALTHIDIKEIDSAIVILKEALEESKKQDDGRSLAGAYTALGKIYLDQKQYNKAKEHFEASMFIGGKAEYASRLVNTKHALALIAIKTGKLQEAETYLIDARSKSKKLNYTSQLLTNYKYTAQLDSLKGNHSSALKWKKKHAALLVKEKHKNQSK